MKQAIQIIEAEIEKMEAQLFKLRNRLDEVDPNHPFEWSRIAQSIKFIADRIESYKLLKKKLEAK